MLISSEAAPRGLQMASLPRGLSLCMGIPGISLCVQSFSSSAPVMLEKSPL